MRLVRAWITVVLVAGLARVAVILVEGLAWVVVMPVEGLARRKGRCSVKVDEGGHKARWEAGEDERVLTKSGVLIQ